MKLNILILITFISSQFLFSQEQIKKWDYPVLPGTDEWTQLKNRDEKVRTCQIPDSVLILLNTNELFELCMRYPLIGDIMAFNNTHDGFSSYKSNFNGIQELFKRKDFKKLLLKRYSNVDPLGYDKNASNIKIGEYSWNIMILELYLAQDEVINNFNSNEKKELVHLLVDKKEEKKKSKIYSYHSFMSIYYTLLRIIISENYALIEHSDKKPELDNFSVNGNFRNTDLTNEIDLLVNEFNKR